MRQFVRPVATALGIACLAVSMAILSTGGALAQAKQAPPAPAKQAAPAPEPEAKQIALTEKQIEGVLAAKKDFDAIGDKRPSDVPAELNAVAKKYGFASYADHETVVDNIKLVLAGVDPATKKYVGEEAVIKAGIARVQAEENVGRGQEGSARRTQGGPEVAIARGHVQGQHRSRRQALRQACRSLGRRSVMVVA